MGFTYNTVYLYDDGTVWGCGDQSLYELGYFSTTTEDIKIPTKLSVSNVKQIAGAFRSWLYLLEDGTVWGGGANNYGILGLGHTNTPQTSYQQVPITGVKAISCGYYHTIFLMEDGTVKGVGYNGYGQLGLGTAYLQELNIVTIPITNVKSVACGRNYTIFVLNDGTVRVCGQNGNYSLGTGDTTNRTTPTSLALTNVMSVSCGMSHTIFLMNDGTVKGVGHNNYGQLGNGETSLVTTPTTIGITNVRQVSCGFYYTIFLLADGTVKGCGYNSHYELGNSSTSHSYSIITIPITDVKTVACSSHSTVFQKTNGNIYVCGYNSNYILGTGSTANPQVPTLHPYLPATSVKALWENSFNFVYDTVNAYYCTTQDIDTTVKGKLTGVTVTDNSTNTDVTIRYAIKLDSGIYTYNGTDWTSITQSDVITGGITTNSINTLSWQDFSKLPSSNNIALIIGIKTSSQYISPDVSDVLFSFSDKYAIGAETIQTTNANQLITDSWQSITSVEIQETINSYTDIRYAISTDGRINWLSYYDGKWNAIALSDLETKGMTVDTFAGLTSSQLTSILKNTIDLTILFKSTEDIYTPKLDNIKFNYVELPSLVTTTSINIPVPNLGYRNVLTDEVNVIYTLMLADGIAFDSATTDYDFYTTADRLILKSLNLGTMIGGKTQNIFTFEVINGYPDKAFSVLLNGMTNDGTLAEAKSNYGLLYDHADVKGRTKVELSLDPNQFATTSYPLQFNLAASQKQIVYLRVTPTVYTTIGAKQMRIKLTGRPI